MAYDTHKWIYETDQKDDIRYVLGTKGDKPLLCFGINPSTAKPDDLDNTLKSVERLALSNGFDSWVVMNIYPQRATDPNDMHKALNDEIHSKNMKFIEQIISTNNTTIWAAWGTLIEKRSYLINCLLDIFDLSQKYKCNWVSIGNNSKKGHPHHPLYLSSIERIMKFNIKKYISELKNSLPNHRPT
jgi:hypothetical protein